MMPKKINPEPPEGGDIESLGLRHRSTNSSTADPNQPSNTQEDKDFRRISVLNGFETTDVPHLDRLKSNLTDISSADVKASAEEMILFVQAAKNIKKMAPEYVHENLPRKDDPGAAQFYISFLSALMVLLKPTLKFARWGATIRVLFLLFLSYSDMITDILVGMRFYDKGKETGDFDDFYQTAGILATAVFFHVLLSLIKNAKRDISVKIRGALFALFLLSPAIESFNYWRGEERTEDHVMEPVLFLVAARAVEMVLESLPEAAIQMKIMFKTEVPETLMIVSIAASIIAAGYTMADTNISFERNKMNAQARGVGSHPAWGIIPSSQVGIAVMSFGFFVFHMCYLASGVLSMTGIFLSFKPIYVLIILALEYVVVLGCVYWRQGNLHIPTERKHNLSFMSLVSWFVLGPLMNSFTPFVVARTVAIFGRGFQIKWLVYRLALNCFVFRSAVEKFEGNEEIKVKPDDAWNLMLAVTIGAAAGYLLIVTSARDTRRYQLYTTRETPHEHSSRFFVGDFLTYNYTCLDEQAADFFLDLHPSVCDLSVVTGWIVSLKRSSYLFSGKVLPKTAGEIAGWEIPKFFDEMEMHLSYFERFKDDESKNDLATAQEKLKRLRAEVLEDTKKREEEEDEKEKDKKVRGEDGGRREVVTTVCVERESLIAQGTKLEQEQEKQIKRLVKKNMDLASEIEGVVVKMETRDEEREKQVQSLASENKSLAAEVIKLRARLSAA
jgi:hypothetical protein